MQIETCQPRPPIFSPPISEQSQAFLSHQGSVPLLDLMHESLCRVQSRQRWVIGVAVGGGQGQVCLTF